MKRFLFGLVAGCGIGSAAPAGALNTLEERLSGWSVWDGRVLLCRDPVAHQGVKEIHCQPASPGGD